MSVQKGTPILGITYGIHLESVHEYLGFTGRKQIGHFQLINMTEQRFETLFLVLNEAIAFDLS